MFCPKCGTENPETGRFCRSCGTDLGNVNAALSGNLPAPPYVSAEMPPIGYKARRRQDPTELFGDAVKQILTGVGFVIVSLALLLTGVAGGRFWWWAMLFPAFGCLSKGVSDYLKSKRIEKNQLGYANSTNLPPAQNFGALSAPSAENLYEIERLLDDNRKIEAVKIYRESTGVGLKEAKDAVEAIERQRSFASGYVEPPRGSIYDTGDLQAPSSVTENTTRHLQLNKDDEPFTDAETRTK